jgi:multidrug efflux system membrane fusion protein
MRAILLLAITILAAWWGIIKFSGGNKNKEPAPAIKVSVADVIRKDMPVSLSLPGNVVAYETVAVRSRIDSQVTEVKFADGDAVTQRQVLFILDDRSLKAQIKQLEANLQKEKSQLENTRLQYERAKNLILSKFVSQSQLDDAKAAFNAQLAVMEAAQANLDNTRVLLSYSTITAPISGRAGTINVTQGNNVKANDATMVTINQVKPIRVQVAVPENYYAEVKEAMEKTIPVSATRQENPEVEKGTLEYIDNTIDPTTGSFLARAVFANEKEALWPGMFVTATLELGQETGRLTIPAVAVQGDEGNHFVFKAEGGKAVKTPVEIARTANDMAIISKGLAEGEKVIVDGLLRISDGSAIEVAAPKEQGGKQGQDESKN